MDFKQELEVTISLEVLASQEGLMSCTKMPWLCDH